MPKTILHCKHCHSEEELMWDMDMNTRLGKRGLCFSCNFWYEYSEAQKGNKYPGRQVIIRDEMSGSLWHYMIGAELRNVPASFKGFGGDKFTIQFLDSESSVVTTNLWSQGEIPKVWEEHFKVNAKFL